MENKEPFGTFWNLYPIRKNVVAARESWRIAIKKVSPEMILEAVEKYANDPHRDPSYTPFPARWLDEERWHDGPTPPRKLTEQEAKEREIEIAKIRDEKERKRSQDIANEFQLAKEKSVPMPDEIRSFLTSKGLLSPKHE